MPVTRHRNRAIVLLSGGLDSATTLYLAKRRGYRCLCLIFDYGQRHKKEIQAAKRIAKSAHCPFQVIRFRLPSKGSSLLDRTLRIPERANGLMRQREDKIPSTYVPARNIIFLSFAVSFAEANNARAIFIGANSIDYSGYPDCRPEFYRYFSRAVQKGTKTGVSGKPIQIFTPLITKSKKDIIKIGNGLGVPYRLTWSCYKGEKVPCGKCDSCLLRQRGFQQAGLRDPLL